MSKLDFNWILVEAKMKRIFVFLLYVISFCHLIKGEFEERTELSFRVRAIYKGEGVKIFQINFKSNFNKIKQFLSNLPLSNFTEALIFVCYMDLFR